MTEAERRLLLLVAAALRDGRPLEASLRDELQAAIDAVVREEIEVRAMRREPAAEAVAKALKVLNQG